MSDHVVVLELAGQDKLARDLVAGGVFVPGYAIALNEECELVLRGATDEVRVHALVVWSNGTGIGLQLHNCDADMKQRIAALAGVAGAIESVAASSDGADASDGAQSHGAADSNIDAATDAAGEADGDGTGDATAEAEADEETPEAKRQSANVHERLRGLTLAQQIKLAHAGEVSERIVLERLYGKAVWEALLRNPRLTGPEVARIARMGSLPRPLVEIIVGNGGWLQIPEVRRALLTNPRLGTDQVMRILRLLPKHELKLAGMQTAYPMAVRDAAKRMIKEAGGG